VRNPSGCARAEPVKWRRAVVASTTADGTANHRGKRARYEEDEEAEGLQLGNVEKLRNLNDSVRAPATASGRTQPCDAVPLATGALPLQGQAFQHPRLGAVCQDPDPEGRDAD